MFTLENALRVIDVFNILINLLYVFDRLCSET